MAPSYDKCRTCYSNPTEVDISGLSIAAEEGASLAFRFDNGAHNMQVLLPIQLTLEWASSGKVEIIQ